MKVPVSPFLTAPSDAVRHGEWLLATADGDAPLPKELTHWDYQSTLELMAPVSVDRRLVTTACDLQWASGLEVIVMARSNHTNAEVLAARLEVPQADIFDLAVELRLPGDELGGRLTLETLLVVTDPLPTSRLAPQAPGSIVWRESHWADLEGVGTQFPTDTIDFSIAGLDPRAGWKFKIDLSDPETRFMSAARLTLNSGHPAIGRLLAGAKDEGTEQLLRTLHWDVTRQLVQAALSSEAVISSELEPDGTSVTAVLRNLLGRIWPIHSPATLANWMQGDRERLEVHLQHFSGLLK